MFNILPACDNCCHLQITIANSLDPDQAQKPIRTNQDPNCLTLMGFLKEFMKMLILGKKKADDKKACKNITCKEVTMCNNGCLKENRASNMFRKSFNLSSFNFFGITFQEYHQCQTMWIQITAE